jgi:hypothetical protein
LRHERTATDLPANPSILVQPLECSRHRSQADPEFARKPAKGGEAITGLQPACSDGLANRIGDLLVSGAAAIRVEICDAQESRHCSGIVIVQLFAIQRKPPFQFRVAAEKLAGNRKGC